MRTLRLLAVAATLAAALLSGSGVAAAPAFGDPAFQVQWQRGEAQTSNFWGPLATAKDGEQEPYKQTPGGSRLVQYFDKGRMELTNGVVTNGLLATELVKGQIQVGDNTFQPRPPPDMPIAGDPDNPGPTYAALNGKAAGLLSPAKARIGGQVIAAVGADGAVGRTGTAGGDVNIAAFDDATQHNVPGVFVDYRSKAGLLAIGYAISEPFLAKVKVSGTPRTVLVQVFERRVLTYTADNPSAFRVEMGNIGLHYYQWRNATSGMASTIGPTYGGVSWRGDFETGDLSQWAEVHAGGTAGDSSARVVTAPVRQGRYAAELALTGTGTSANVRAELSASQGQTGGYDGQAWYYSWSMYVPSAPNARTGWNAAWNLIAQWSPMGFADLGGCSPPIELDIRPVGGTPHLVFVRNDQPFSGTRCGAEKSNGSYDFGTLTYDRWVDLTVHVKYGTNAATGYVEAWVDGVAALPRTAMRTEYRPAGSYLELDLYRPDFAGTNVIYVDDMTRHDAFSQHPAPHIGQEIGLGNGQVGFVGGDEVEADDHPRPADAQMQPQPVIGLAHEFILAVGGVLAQAAAAAGAGEPADRDRAAVDNREGGIVGNPGEEMLPEALLDAPEVRGLASEGGPVDGAQPREVVGVLAAEVGVDALIGGDTEEGASHLDGKDFAVVQDRLRSAFAHALAAVFASEKWALRQPW